MSDVEDLGVNLLTLGVGGQLQEQQHRERPDETVHVGWIDQSAVAPERGDTEWTCQGGGKMGCSQALIN